MLTSNNDHDRDNKKINKEIKFPGKKNNRKLKKKKKEEVRGKGILKDGPGREKRESVPVGR